MESWFSEAPYTHLQSKIRKLALFLHQQEPKLSFRFLKKHVSEQVHELMKGRIGRLWERDRCMRRVIRMYGKEQQRTEAWYTARDKMITASEVSDAWGTPAARRTLMLRKLEPRKEGGQGTCMALIWGTRMEPVAKSIFEEETQCKVIDVSCVQHRKYGFLGASPDGIVIPTVPGDEFRRGRLVEFKCPYSRAETPGIPASYMHQMQMQMECTGIDECEYVEFRFKQVTQSVWAEHTGRKGMIAVVDDSGEVHYKPDSADPKEWRRTLPEDCQFVYWVLMSQKKEFVPKDMAWLPSHLPDLQKTWDEICEHRKNGTLPEAPVSSVPSLDL